MRNQLVNSCLTMTLKSKLFGSTFRLWLYRDGSSSRGLTESKDGWLYSIFFSNRLPNVFLVMVGISAGDAIPSDAGKK